MPIPVGQYSQHRDGSTLIRFQPSKGDPKIVSVNSPEITHLKSKGIIGKDAIQTAKVATASLSQPGRQAFEVPNGGVLKLKLNHPEAIAKIQPVSNGKKSETGETEAGKGILVPPRVEIHAAVDGSKVEAPLGGHNGVKVTNSKGNDKHPLGREHASSEFPNAALVFNKSEPKGFQLIPGEMNIAKVDAAAANEAWGAFS